MEIVKAECTTKKEIFKGVVLTEFQYEFSFKGGVSLNSHSFELVTADHDLNLVWTIEHSLAAKNSVVRCYWSKIKLPECPKNISGSFEIYSIEGKKHFCTFNTESLPLEESLWIYCEEDKSSITIVIQVYREFDNMRSMVEDYEKLMENERNSDVVFVVGNQEIPGHKQIVSARSEVFAAMFGSDMTERKTDRVYVLDIEPDTFRLLLRYVYCGRVDCFEVQGLIKLMKAAHKYLVKSLVNICGYYIADNLHFDNVVEILVTADLLKAEVLKKDCMRFIARFKNEVAGTWAYKEMLKTRADLLSELFLMIKDK